MGRGRWANDECWRTLGAGDHPKSRESRDWVAMSARYVPLIRAEQDSVLFPRVSNRNKKSMTLNLQHPGGREVLHRPGGDFVGWGGSTICAGTFRPGWVWTIRRLSAVKAQLCAARFPRSDDNGSRAGEPGSII